MSNPREQLTHLLELAADPNTESRGALAEELRALLAHWPDAYGPEARAPFEALLDKITRDSAKTKPGESELIELLRAGNVRVFEAAFACACNERIEAVREALGDDSGMHLAALCRKAEVSRAGFSTIVLLTRPSRADTAMQGALRAFEAAQDARAAE
jgi:hypothetical protein